MISNWVSLHSHSTYSFLDGFGQPSELVSRAKELEMKAIALTDHGSVSGHPMLEKYALDVGIKPIFGNEFYTSEDALARDKDYRHKCHLTTLAMSQTGYSNLLHLTTKSFKEGFYYKASVDEKMLFERNEGLIVLSGCFNGKLQQLIKQGNIQEAYAMASRYKAVFGDRYYLETQHYLLLKDTYKSLLEIGRSLHIPVVVTIDNHYLKKDQGLLREILWAIRDRRKFNPENVAEDAALMSAEETLGYLRLLDSDIQWESMVERAGEIAERCNVKLKRGDLPHFPVPAEFKTSHLYLSYLCAEGMKKRGIYGVQDYKDRILVELSLIKEKSFSDYFLIVWDVINWAKSNDILVGPGRGSSAGSLVAYCLGITEVNPLHFGLLFERFLESTRTDYPDIDIDFEDDKRYLVKNYLASKYGREHVVQLGTFAQFKGKNSLDEVGKVFSIPKGPIEEVKSYLVDRSGGDMRAQMGTLDTFEISPRAREIAKQYPDIMAAAYLEGQYRHMGSHAAGVLLCNEPMQDILAFYSRSEEDEGQVASVDYDGAKYLNLIKLDLLGLTELSIIRDIGRANGLTVRDIYAIPLDDAKTIEAFANTDVLGVFQSEGESTKSILRQLHCSNFKDIVDSVALSKPGASHSGGASAYLARKNGRDAPGFDFHPLLQELTAETYGQILYQEQVLQIVQRIGNFGMTEANAIRNLISKSQGEELFESYWDRFKEGGAANGLSSEQARKIWEGLKTYGRFGFNKSHSVVYGVVSYLSMYMKQHFPRHFYLYHIQREKDERKKRKLMQESTRRGFRVLGPRFGYSGVGWSIDQDGGLRAGLVEIPGIAEKTAEEINKYGAIFSVDDVSADMPKRVRTIIAKNNLFFDERDDYFRLEFDQRLVSFKGNKCIDIDWDDQSYDVEMCGVIFEWNQKDYAEELRSRGKSDQNIRNPELLKYAMVMVEDDSDSLMMQIDRYVFPRFQNVAWKAYQEHLPVILKGRKIKGWRIISIKEMKLA